MAAIFLDPVLAESRRWKTPREVLNESQSLSASVQDRVHARSAQCTSPTGVGPVGLGVSEAFAVATRLDWPDWRIVSGCTPFTIATIAVVFDSTSTTRWQLDPSTALRLRSNSR